MVRNLNIYPYKVTAVLQREGKPQTQRLLYWSTATLTCKHLIYFPIKRCLHTTFAEVWFTSFTKRRKCLVENKTCKVMDVPWMLEAMTDSGCFVECGRAAWDPRDCRKAPATDKNKTETDKNYRPAGHKSDGKWKTVENRRSVQTGSL